MLIYGMENQSIKLMLIWDTKRPKRPPPSRASVVKYGTDEVKLYTVSPTRLLLSLTKSETRTEREKQDE